MAEFADQILVVTGAFTLAGLLALLAAVRRGAVPIRQQIERLQDRLFEIADSEERYRSLIEAQGDLIVRETSDRTMAYANETYRRMAGADAGMPAGQVPRLTVLERTEPVVRPDGSRLTDEKVATADGERWISWVETVVMDREGRSESLRVGRDVTERVRAAAALEEARQRAEAANDAKSQFLAMVSHEVRTPLNGILGMAGLLESTALTAEQKTYVSAVASSGQALLSLIDEILDFSRIEAGRLDLVAARFDLHQLVEGVVELLAPRAQGKGIEIAASVALGVPQFVVGDRDRLRQVLVNLAGNAVKFTHSGGVGIRLSRGTAGFVDIEVADTGPGIPHEKLDSIFERFERVDGSPSVAVEGTGLGLAISRRIVERMQGRIGVESRLGRGSTFTISLPLPDADHATLPPARPDLGHRRALIVSRSPFEAPFLMSRLEEAGGIAERVASVAAAERCLAARAYDLLIADCALGDAATKRLAAAARQHGVDRTLVLLSPFERRDFGPPQAAGFDGYLVKPIRPRSLFARLSDAAPAAAQPAAEPAPGAGLAPAAFHVLVAEDNDINALLVTRMIEKLGGSADRVANGHDAVSRLGARGRSRYDLALLDIRMPGLDGMAAARAVRAREHDRGLMPVRLVAVTANVSPADREAAMAAGFDDFLPKPLDPAALQALIRALPHRKRRRAAARRAAGAP